MADTSIDRDAEIPTRLKIAVQRMERIAAGRAVLGRAGVADLDIILRALREAAARPDDSGTGGMARIEGTDIVIRIPIAALPDACKVAWDEEWGEGEHDIAVVDAPLFAKDFVAALNREQEDGTTPVHLMLDKAAIEAAEQGAEGLSEA